VCTCQYTSGDGYHHPSAGIYRFSSPLMTSLTTNRLLRFLILFTLNAGIAPTQANTTRPITAIFTEVAENINSINAHFGFVRGAVI
jgi:hypothetical protein